ncbi:transposase [Escherichia coli]|nr:transposase [Escherichia coli]OKT24449.1 transposase [Escherichia coli]OKT37410.1 transposase [Escherichia coli]OKT75343.1 transposase [Escherichia coli]OKT80428.1 transposase [Escherichia coli]
MNEFFTVFNLFFYVIKLIKKITVDSIGQRNSYVKTWGCGGFLNETNIYSRGKSLCF